MSVSTLSTSTQNYLKAIWAIGEWSGQPATPSTIAARTGLKLSTVSGAMPKLARDGFVEHTPYGSVALTDEGRAHAVAMIRRHRLIETFLVQTLGYGWDEVHDEAEHLEHAVSDLMIDRIDALLGNPRRDPHGDPIPAADGSVEIPDAVPLSAVAPGTRVRVERISDEDPELLQFLATNRISWGSELTVEAGAPFSGSLTVVAADGDALQLGQQASEALFVSVR